MVLDDVPDNRVIDPEVPVDQTITHPRHSAPVNTWKLSPEIVRDVLRGFTNYFETSHERALQRLVLPEVIRSQTSAVAQEEVRFIEDMAESVTRLE